MKKLKQRIAKAFGGGGTSERGTSNLEIVVWISVVLVIAVGMFFLRDNIAKFINNAATQIAGEESRPEGMNEYGFYFGKVYKTEGWDTGMIFFEDGRVANVMPDGSLDYAPENYSYSNGAATSIECGSVSFSPDGKSADIGNGNVLKLQE